MTRDEEEDTMFRQVIKFALTAFVTGLCTAFAATLYSLAVSQVTTDESASQRAEMVYLLKQISQNLNSGSLSSSIGTRSVDLNSLQPVDIEKLGLANDPLQYYKREFLIGAKLYRTSISLSGVAESGIQKADIRKIDWAFDGEPIGSTPGAQPLFLSKVKKPLFSSFTSKKSFDVTAQVWLNDEIAKDEDIINPVELKTNLQW